MKNKKKISKVKQYIVRSKLWNFPSPEEDAIAYSLAMGYSHLITAKNKAEARAKCEQDVIAQAQRTGARSWRVVKNFRIATAEDLRMFWEVEF